MTPTAPILDRAKMLRALPRHLMLALLCGAIAGPVLFGLHELNTSGLTALLKKLIMGAVFVNAAILPFALPGRHWSFAFIGAMMMLMLLVPAHVILEPRIPLFFPQKVCTILWASVIGGAALGLFYGLLSGKRSALLVGLMCGASTGYAVGILATFIVYDGFQWNLWRYPFWMHFIWQGALAMFLLHLGAGLGATMGAGKSERG